MKLWHFSCKSKADQLRGMNPSMEVGKWITLYLRPHQLYHYQYISVSCTSGPINAKHPSIHRQLVHQTKARKHSEDWTTLYYDKQCDKQKHLKKLNNTSGVVLSCQLHTQPSSGLVVLIANHFYCDSSQTINPNHIWRVKSSHESMITLTSGNLT